MGKFCKYCGGEAAPGNTICRFCGRQLEAPGAMAAPGTGAGPASFLTRQDFIVIGALMALALVLVFIAVVT